MKQRLYHLLEPGPHRLDRGEKAVDVVILTLILVSVGAVILRTDREIAQAFGDQLAAIQWFTTIVFTVEYVLRVYCCTEDPRYARPIVGRLRFMVTPMELIDLFAVLPFYVVALLAPGSQIVGAMLMLRMLRLLKLFRYSRSLAAFARVLKDKGDQLIAASLMTGVLLVLSSSVVYFAERGAQPKAFASILDTMWWGIITLTTVGYGDVSPVTPLGQLFGAVTAVIGIGLVALPSGILASGFIETFAEQEQAEEGRHEKGHQGGARRDGAPPPEGASGATRVREDIAVRPDNLTESTGDDRAPCPHCGRPT